MSNIQTASKKVKQNTSRELIHVATQKARQSVKTQNILRELKALPQWVCWKYGEKILPNGKPEKIPIDPRTGRNASPTNPDTWYTYDQAITRMRVEAELAGIGFVLTEENNLVGIDLDECFYKGVLKPEARRIVSLLDSYTEYSPSGQGFRIFVKGKKPDARCRPSEKIHTDDMHSFFEGIEVYDHARYLTITGDVFEQHNTIQTRDLTEFYKRYFGEEEKPPPVSQAHSLSLDIDDQTLLEKAMKEPEFQALWNGDWNSGRFPSQSEADFKFCRKLAYWTGNDRDRIDRLFRQSGLMRTKWDEKHGKKTYGQRTIENAIKKTTTVYDPNYRSKQSPPLIQEPPHPAETQQPKKKQPPPPTETQQPKRIHIDLTYTFTEETPLISLQESRLLSIGNMMGIVSGIGTGKSHLCELFAALWLNPFCEPDGSIDMNSEGLCLYIDTERTTNDCFKGFQRIYRRVDLTKHPELLNEAKTDFQNLRFESFISIESPEAKQGELGELIHQYGEQQQLRFLIIDGILDLCLNPNSIDESTRLGHRLLSLANQYHFGILYTIHGNRNDPTGKGKGWIGDVFQRKSESFLRLTRDPEEREIRVLTTDFENRKIRSGPDNVFTGFKWSPEKGMFVEISYSPPEAVKQTFSLLEKFQWAFTHLRRSTATFTDLLTFYKTKLELSKATLRRDLKKAIEQKILTKDEKTGEYRLNEKAEKQLFEDMYPLNST